MNPPEQCAAQRTSGRRRRTLRCWPPSAAQTARAVFPHAAFTKTLREMLPRATAKRTLCAPVGSIEAASVLGRRCTGFSKKELIHLIALTRLAALLFRPVFVRRLPRPTRSRRSLGHAAFAALQVLFSGPTTDRASLATSLALIGLLTPTASRRLRQFS